MTMTAIHSGIDAKGELMHRFILVYTGDSSIVGQADTIEEMRTARNQRCVDQTRHLPPSAQASELKLYRIYELRTNEPWALEGLNP